MIRIIGIDLVGKYWLPSRAMPKRKKIMEDKHSIEKTVGEVLALDRARVDIINQGRISELKEIFAEDLIHVHATGRVDDRDAVLLNFTSSPRKIRPRTAAVRVYDAVAVLTGRQVSDSAKGVSDLFVTQVAHRKDGKWRFVSFHACKSDPLPG